GAGAHPALSRPAGYDMKVPSEIEIPRRQEKEHQVHQRTAEQQRDCRLNQASETAAAPALRQFVVKRVTTSHGIGRAAPNIPGAPRNPVVLANRYKKRLSYQRENAAAAAEGSRPKPR